REVFSRAVLAEGVWPVHARVNRSVVQNFIEHFGRINDAVLIYVTADEVDNSAAFILQTIVQKIERVFRDAQIGREIGKEHFHALQSSSLRNARIARMFETTFQ